MKRLGILVIIAVLLLMARAYVQGIQEYRIQDFSGGMVNSIDNSLMADNQELVLENYDIVNGELVRRKGFSLYNPDAFSGLPIEALLPFMAEQVDKDLLTLRSLTTHFPINVADTHILILTACDEAGLNCTTVVAKPFYSGRKNANIPYNVTSQTSNGRLIMAVANSEMWLYDGSKAFPARPRAPGQPLAVALDGDGGMNGIFRYRFLFKEDTRGPSDLSPPSWSVRVKDGNVFLAELGPVTISSLQDSVIVYRSKDDGPYQELVRFSTTIGGNGAQIVGGYGYYIDTVVATAAADTLAFPWGVHTNCIYGACSSVDSVPAPGVMRSASVGVATVGYGTTARLGGLTDTTCLSLAHAIVYEDSAGRQSYASPPSCNSYTAATILATAGRTKDSLWDIPVPRDSGIVRKILLRWAGGSIAYINAGLPKLSRIPVQVGTSGFRYGITINGITTGWTPTGAVTAAAAIDSTAKYINADATLSAIVNALDTSNTYLYLEARELGGGFVVNSYHQPTGHSTYDQFGQLTPDTDEIVQHPISSQDYLYNFVILDTLDDTTTIYVDSIPYDSLQIIPWCIDSSNAQEPTEFCYDDSNITFQPFDIAYHGDRLWAIGDLDDKNSLWYSDFGRPTTFGIDHFLPVESPGGDWFVRLLSIGENLLMFRQNSIYQLYGLSFFQFQLNQVLKGVGVSAPRSLVAGRGLAYFMHESGVYAYPFNPQGQALSWVIEKTLDSIGTNLRRSVGGLVGQEYWLSVPLSSTENNQTLIFDPVPNPHWRTYSFGMNGIVLYDNDTLAIDYTTEKFIFIGANDSLYKWNYDVADTTDAGTRIIAKYQSKYFFQEVGELKRREKIFYVDMFGTGTADSLTCFFYSKGVAVDSVKFKPNFADNKVDRVVFNRISDDFSFGWRDNGLGQYSITGYTIGFAVWDDGRR